MSSFHYDKDNDDTNGEHTNNTKADNQMQGGVFRIKKVIKNKLITEINITKKIIQTTAC